MKDIICRELKSIEITYGVKILHAVESGSRAWGFASPDSDYDVRYIYVRSVRDYLRLDEPRDVIEQIDAEDVLDINGWDIKKALKQFARANATLFEWSNSPVVYKTTGEWAAVYDVAKTYFSEKAAVCHYYGTAMNTWSEHLTSETVRYKKYFYALRPLLAAKYIEQFHAVPPVLFDDLLKMEMEPALRTAIGNLLEMKKRTTEGEYNPYIPEIHDFIREELPRQKAICDNYPDDRNTDWTPLNDCFAKIIGMKGMFER